MQNSKLPFTLLFLGLAVLGYQVLMHPTVKEQNFAKHFLIGHGDLAEDQTNTNLNPNHKKVIHSQVTGLAFATPTPTSASAPTVAASPTPAPVDLKSLAKAADDKTKAKDDKDKKKKKKKKTVSATPDAGAQNVNPAPPAAAAVEDVPPAPVAPQPTQAVGSNTNNNNNTNSNVSAKDNAMIQYYESLLLGTPDIAATQKFVASYKAKSIPDVVYFAVAAAMMADSRLQMKDLAVYVYGQVINIKSFEALVTVIDTDTANDVVKTDSLKYLASYSDVTVSNSVTVLGQALAAPLTTASLHIEALKLLDTAAKQYAQLEVSQTTSGSGQITTYAYTPTNAQKLFDPLLTVLNTLLRSTTDTTTKTVATQDIGDIQSLVGSESASINP